VLTSWCAIGWHAWQPIPQSTNHDDKLALPHDKPAARMGLLPLNMLLGTGSTEWRWCRWLNVDQ
jgi:hypothetical protein